MQSTTNSIATVNPDWHTLCATCAETLCRDHNVSQSDRDLSDLFSRNFNLTHLEAITVWVSEIWMRNRYSTFSICPHLSDELDLEFRKQLMTLDYYAIKAMEEL